MSPPQKPGFFIWCPLSGNSNWASSSTLNWLVLHIPPHIHTHRQTDTHPKEILFPYVEGVYECFQELHIVSITGRNFAHVKKCVKKTQNKLNNHQINIVHVHLYLKNYLMPRKMLLEEIASKWSWLFASEVFSKGGMEGGWLSLLVRAWFLEGLVSRKTYF